MIDRMNAVVHERDGLLATVELLRSALTAAGTAARHRFTLTCDRCKTQLMLGSATEHGDLEMCHALAQAAIALRWQFSEATAQALFCPGAAKHLELDYCPACAALLVASEVVP